MLRNSHSFAAQATAGEACMRDDAAPVSSGSPDAARHLRGVAVRRFRPSLIATLQARRIRLWLALAGKGLLRLKVEVAGLEHVPRGEPLIVAAAPHRNWIDPFLLLLILPPTPRLYFVGSADASSNRWWKRVAIELAGGMVPVSTTERGKLNRDGLELSLAILEAGSRVGIFPEGWVNGSATEIEPLRRGVAFLSQQSGRRVLPVALAGTKELWRGKTLRACIAPPLDALERDANRREEQAYVDRLREVLQASLPPAPADPASGKKPWRWLTGLM
jgi:1-acyl-sn-glycerol-3-phosphate acyltransferase